jgi:hypothetical protein
MVNEASAGALQSLLIDVALLYNWSVYMLCELSTSGGMFEK